MPRLPSSAFRTRDTEARGTVQAWCQASTAVPRALRAWLRRPRPGVWPGWKADTISGRKFDNIEKDSSNMDLRFTDRVQIWCRDQTLADADLVEFPVAIPDIAESTQKFQALCELSDLSPLGSPSAQIFTCTTSDEGGASRRPPPIPPAQRAP